MQRFVSVILNVPVPVESVMMQFADQAKKRFILQLIRGISRVPHKLLKYFNATAFQLPFYYHQHVILILNLNDSESVMLSFGLSLWYCHKHLDVSTSRSFALSILHYSFLPFILLMQLVNGAQFLNVTCLFFASAFLAAASAPAPLIVMVLSTSMYASL